MTVEEIEEFLRRYVSTVVAAVVVALSPSGVEADTLERDGTAEESTDPAPAPDGGAGPDAGGEPPTPEPVTAGERLGWGEPDREDDFTGDLARWDLYTGPGHDGRGTRSPEAATVVDGILTITGDAAGTTAGMAWNPGQRHGRWEARVRTPESDPTYDAVLLLWPDAEDFPVGGEIDFMEMRDPARQQADFFLHHGPDNEQVQDTVQVDGTQWHHWAVEWTPEAIVGYLDGEEWFRSTDTATFPPGPMHLCIQLDWFPGDAEVAELARESTMQVDWVRQWGPPA